MDTESASQIATDPLGGLQFGSVPLGQSCVGSIEIANLGPSPVPLRIEGDISESAKDFAVRRPQGWPMLKDRLRLDVVFTPRGIGRRTRELTLSTSITHSSHRVRVVGIGVAPGALEIVEVARREEEGGSHHFITIGNDAYYSGLAAAGWTFHGRLSIATCSYGNTPDMNRRGAGRIPFPASVSLTGRDTIIEAFLVHPLFGRHLCRHQAWVDNAQVADEIRKALPHLFRNPLGDDCDHCLNRPVDSTLRWRQGMVVRKDGQHWVVASSDAVNQMWHHHPIDKRWVVGARIKLVKHPTSSNQ